MSSGMNLAGELARRRARSKDEPLRAVLGDFWARQIGRLRQAHADGAGGTETARAIAAAVDAVVLEAYADALQQGREEGHSLVALGGYGRQKMSPHSDIDLLFLFAKEKQKDPAFISGVLHPLWDVGFDLGHSSRTVAEAVRLLRDDLESCTAMMDGRFLAGDRGLFEEFQERLYKRMPRSMVATLQKMCRTRSRRNGTVQLLEPNVKESPGGLRDIHALEWALKAHSRQPGVDSLWSRHLDEQDVKTLERGRGFLWWVRHELHFNVGRRRDVLGHELKPEIAHGLGYQDRGQELAAEGFMRDYYLHARAVHHLVELAFERLTSRRRVSHRSVLLEPGAMAVDGEIVLPRGKRYFADKPLRLLSIFHLAQVKKLRLSEEVQRTIGASLHLVDDELRRSAEARDIFMRILRRKFRTAATLRRMHDLGVLGAYLPEFGSLTCLVQYDIYHLYTADEHTLVALDNLEALAHADKPSNLKQVLSDLERRDLLFLALLLHDIGKSRRQDHIVCGIEMATQLLERLNLPDEDRRFVLFLVEHHQDMVVIAQRRDLDDYKMIAEFARLFASMEWLKALYLLSYADLSAVVSDAWTDWQGALLWELYYKTSEQFQSGMKTFEDKQHARQLLDQYLKRLRGVWPALKIAAFQEHVEQLPPHYLLAYEQDQVELHQSLLERLGDKNVEVEFIEHPGHTEILVCSRDQRQLLAKICGSLAVNDINILRADVHTRDDDMVLDIFQVTDVDGSPVLPDWKKARVRERLEEVVTLRLKARELLERYSVQWDRRKHKTQKRTPEVGIENQVSDRYTVIDVSMQDEVGLLYKITHALAELDLDIHMAIINTVARRAADSFYVVDDQGRKIVNYEVLEDVRQSLIEKLGA